MVARPSLKRVVPGSIPPWRALCAESPRSLKAFFAILCVSLQQSAKLARFLLARAWAAGTAGPRGSFLAVARSAELPSWWGALQLSQTRTQNHRQAAGAASRSASQWKQFPGPLRVILCPCNILLATCQFVLFAACRFLQLVTYFVGRAARAPSRRLAFAALDLLICAGVEAGPW